jgi:hypothetical protein
VSEIAPTGPELVNTSTKSPEVNVSDIDNRETSTDHELATQDYWMKHVDWRAVCEKVEQRIYWTACVITWFFGLYILRVVIAPELEHFHISSRWGETWAEWIWYFAWVPWLFSGPLTGNIVKRLVFFDLPENGV